MATTRKAMMRNSPAEVATLTNAQLERRIRKLRKEAQEAFVSAVEANLKRTANQLEAELRNRLAKSEA